MLSQLAEAFNLQRMLSSSALGSTGTPSMALGSMATPPRPPSAKQPSSAWLAPAVPAAGGGGIKLLAILMMWHQIVGIVWALKNLTLHFFTSCMISYLEVLFISFLTASILLTRHLWLHLLQLEILLGLLRKSLRKVPRWNDRQLHMNIMSHLVVAMMGTMMVMMEMRTLGIVCLLKTIFRKISDLLHPRDQQQRPHQHHRRNHPEERTRRTCMTVNLLQFFSITFKLKHIKLIAFRLTFRRVMSLESMVMLMAMLLLKLESLLSKTLHVRSSTCSFLESNECFAGMAIPWLVSKHMMGSIVSSIQITSLGSILSSLDLKLLGAKSINPINSISIVK